MKAARLVCQASTVACIDLALLKEAAVKGLIIDLENTIVSEDDRIVSPGAEEWIRKAKKEGFQFFLCCNGKQIDRVKFWSERLGIPAIVKAKKPFPFSFMKALSRMHLYPHEVVVIGDSLHTDILGAWLVGCSSIQVASLPHPQHWWEKLFGRLIHTSFHTKNTCF